MSKCPADTPRMITFPEGGATTVVIATECIRLWVMHIKQRDIKAATFGKGVTPDKKDFVYCTCGIYFQLIIAITAINEHFQIIL